MAEGYVVNPYGHGELPSRGGHGWLKVRLDGGTEEFLPEHLKVDVIGTRGNVSTSKSWRVCTPEKWPVLS